jgi:MFS family permease
MKWMVGFFFHDMAFGLLSVFLPLYIFSLSGLLLWVGVMAAAAMLLSIPASFFWGYICDRTRRYKPYVLISFLSSALILYLFVFTSQIIILVILYVIMAGIFDVAYEPPKNVLIAELYPHKEWKRAYAFYEGFANIGLLIGLAFGVLASSYGLSARSTLLLCSGLLLLAFLTSLLLVKDPILILERRNVVIEKAVDFMCRGLSILSRILGGVATNKRLKRERLGVLLCGLALFSLSTSMLFTLMPIFINNMATATALPPSSVYVVYIMNTCGVVAGCFFAVRRGGHGDEGVGIRRATLLRGLLAFLLIVAIQPSPYNIFSVAIILTLLGFVYAIYSINALSLSIGVLPEGKAGLFNALERAGSAIGSLISLIITQTLGFAPIFLISSTLFLIAYIAFRIFA